MTETDAEMLDFERDWWRHAGTKYLEVAARWGMTLSEYHERLVTIAVTPEAYAYDPLTVSRIRRRQIEVKAGAVRARVTRRE